MWETSCLDWRERFLAGRTLVPDLPLFAEQADRAERIFNRLRIPDVVGKPTMLEAGTEWLLPIVRALFGSFDADANRRMVQEFFLLVPKKNSKSSGAAAIMVTAMIVNLRPEAEFLLIAPTKEIADIAFKQARGIMQADDALNALFHCQQHIRTITHRNNGAMLKIKAADTDVITGSKSTGILIDETHVFAKKGNAADIFVEVRGALAARPDGFLIQVTTQSKEPPQGVFKSELATARKVRDGEMVLPLLPILYEIPEDLARDGGWKDRSLWPLVNPNLGKSVDERFLSNQLLKAEEEGPEALALLASQHFNVEIGLSLRNDGWVGSAYWQGAADRTLTLDALIERSEVAVIGIDGGGLDDLLGLAVMGRCRETKRWLLWSHAWAHTDVLDRRKEIVPRLRDFEREGTLTICDYPTQDVEEIADLVERIRDAGLLPEDHAIGLDPQGVTAMVDEIASRKIAEAQIVGVAQGYRLNGAVLGMERKLKDGTLVHAGQDLMAWSVGNAKVEQRGNAVVITKQMAGKAKIDPLMAAFNAVVLLSRNPGAVRARAHQIFVFG